MKKWRRSNIPEEEKVKMIDSILSSDDLLVASMDKDGKVTLFTYCSLVLIEKILPVIKIEADKVIGSLGGE